MICYIFKSGYIFKSSTVQGGNCFQVPICQFCITSSNEILFQFFYWIPITLTIRYGQNKLLINRKWTWWFHFAIQWFYRCHFMEFKKSCKFLKRFNFHFCQTLITLTMQIYYTELLMNLEIKLGFHFVIQIFNFFKTSVS